MVTREEYLEKIKPFMGRNIVKAITGLRRVGKSVFVRQIMESLKAQNVNPKNIIYVDMESLEFDSIKTYHDLNAYVMELAAKAAGKVYVFIDETRNIVEWERAVASWSGRPERFDVTITGSNSTLFSGALATKLTGRYIEFPIYPLSLREFKQFPLRESNNEKIFDLYLKYGGLPGLHSLGEINDITALPYLDTVHGSIVLKDIVERNKIRNVGVLNSICRFTYDNIGNLLSANSISKYLKNQKLSINLQTTVNYLNYLTESQLFYRVPRYDIKGKRQLEINDKFYTVDLGLRNSQIGFKSQDIGQIIENLVYLELCRKGYQIYVGQMDAFEVDFIAVKNGTPNYFQVTVALTDSSVVERETRPLLAIADNHPKTIITLAPAFGDGINGIKVQSLSDFLS